MSRKETILTDQDCRTALYNYTKTKNANLVSFSIEALGSIEGFIGQHFKVNIQYENEGEEHNKQFFLKILNSSLKVMFDIGMSLGAYGKEEFLYNHLIKEFNANGIDTSFAPNFYMCRPYVVLLEDLSQRGYRTTPMKEMLTIEHCKIALKCLAKFHSSTIIYEDIKSREVGSPYSLLEAYPTKLAERFSDPESAFTKFFNCTLQGILEIINFMPAHEIDAETYRKKLVAEVETFADLAKPSKRLRNTITHGDLWSKNIMFAHEGGTPIDALLIDYQTLQYGTPAIDVVVLILTNVRPHLRSGRFNELLMYYYDNFCECLNKRGINAGDVLTLGDFLESCDDVTIMNKAFATAAHSMMFLIDEEIAEAYESEESIEKFFFHDRSKAITTSYNNNEFFKEILLEDLIELRDLLFSK